MEIVLKKDIKAYENIQPKKIYTRNIFKPQITNYRTYTNTQNINCKTIQQKPKKIRIFTSNKISSPTKKDINCIKFIKINNFVTKNLTESRINNRESIFKKKNSKSPNSMNLFESTINNNEKNLDNNSYISLNINNKINNYIKKLSKKEEERLGDDYINKNKDRDKNQRIINSDNYIFFKTINVAKKTRNDFRRRYNICKDMSENSNDDFFSKINKNKIYESLLLSNSGYLNNKILCSELEKDNFLKNEGLLGVNWISSVNKNNNKLHLSYSHNHKENKKEKNNSINKSKFKLINHNAYDKYKKIFSFEKSNSNLEPNSKCNTSENYHKIKNYNIQIEDLIKMKQSYNTLEKINNELDLLNKNLISENNELKLQIINFSTNIYNHTSNEKNEAEANKKIIQKLKSKIIKLSEENETLKKISPDKALIEQYNKAMEESIKLKYSLKKNNIQVKENKKLKEKNEEISKEVQKLKIIENKYNTLYQNNFKLHKKYSLLNKNYEMEKIKNNMLLKKNEELTNNLTIKMNIIDNMNNEINLIKKEIDEKDKIIKEMERTKKNLEKENEYLFNFKSKYDEIEIKNIEIKNKIYKANDLKVKLDILQNDYNEIKKNNKLLQEQCDKYYLIKKEYDIIKNNKINYNDINQKLLDLKTKYESSIKDNLKLKEEINELKKIQYKYEKINQEYDTLKEIRGKYGKLLIEQQNLIQIENKYNDLLQESQEFIEIKIKYDNLKKQYDKIFEENNNFRKIKIINK